MELDILSPAEKDSIFDTHAHYDDSRFGDNRDELLTALKENAGVANIINCGSDIKSSAFSVQLANKYSFVYAAVGIHPEAVKLEDIDLTAIRQLAKEKRVVAIGETGLDYYWEKELKCEQKKAFENQILLAKELNLPVIVHDRDAHADTLEILKKHKPKGVLHCFSGSSEMAKQIIHLGMYIGIGGVATFKNSKKLLEVISEIPLTHILLETDAPYMAPEPHRGKTNHSGYICYVAQKIAEIKGISQNKVLEITRKNAENLFLNK